MDCARLGPGPVAFPAATAPTAAPTRPVELAARSRAVFRRTLRLQLGIGFKLGSEIRPARGGKTGTRPGGGLARTLAARDVARLTGAVVGASHPLSGRLWLQPTAALRLGLGLAEALAGPVGFGGPDPFGFYVGECFGRWGPHAEVFGS